MNFKEYVLLERNLNLPFISIDVQPFYSKFCNKIMPDFTNFANTHKGRIICFFNGSDVGIEDTPQSLQEYFHEFGMNENILERIEFKEKSYAFFRNWMDEDMSRSDLIKAIRHMVINRYNSSEEVSEEEWKKVYGEDWEWGISDIVNADTIYLPDISLSELKQLGGCYLSGGGKDECLSEFRFLLEAFNIRYKLVKNLIY